MNEHDFSSTESALTRAFESRHGAAPSSRPSLADVRRRARRRTSRRASLRVGVGLAVGTAAVAGTWVVTRTDGGGSAVGGPVTPAGEGDSGTGETPTTEIWEQVIESELSTDLLWEAVANQLGTPLEELESLNPDVDFTRPPTPGLSLRHLNARVRRFEPCVVEAYPLSSAVEVLTGVVESVEPHVSVEGLPDSTVLVDVPPTLDVPGSVVIGSIPPGIDPVPCTTTVIPFDTTAPVPETTAAPELPDTTAPAELPDTTIPTELPDTTVPPELPDTTVPPPVETTAGG